MVVFRLFLGVALCLSFDQALFAQSINSLQRQAIKSLNRGDYTAAGANFERAGRLKNSDPALLFRAAEAYRQARDYFNASNCYLVAKTDDQFPLAGLYYARSLKQQGQYQEAKAAFDAAAKAYQGEQKAVILLVIENEIAGCDLALRLAETPDSTVASPSISPLFIPGESHENRFAPLPFSDTLLYFSEAALPQALLMRSSKRNGNWQAPALAQGLPASASKDFLSGCFSVDKQRFYFSRCESPPLAAKGSSVETSNCAIYVLRLDEQGDWGEPEKLRSYINLNGSSNLWPFVCDYGPEEWLFFASNRPGGMGGIDLYTCKRPLLSDDLDFSFPQNLGNKVNTGADETNPFYDVFSKTLWFSSMGHPGLGGLDVHYAVGEASEWAAVKNAGVPINSPADDSYFVLKRDGKGAFLSSNRILIKGANKQSIDNLYEVIFPIQD